MRRFAPLVCARRRYGRANTGLIRLRRAQDPLRYKSSDSVAVSAWKIGPEHQRTCVASSTRPADADHERRSIRRHDEAAMSAVSHVIAAVRRTNCIEWSKSLWAAASRLLKLFFDAASFARRSEGRGPQHIDTTKLINSRALSHTASLSNFDTANCRIRKLKVILRSTAVRRAARATATFGRR